jgi:hypothetical protein
LAGITASTNLSDLRQAAVVIAVLRMPEANYLMQIFASAFLAIRAIETPFASSTPIKCILSVTK